jgi:hypothetical protein
MAKIHTFKNLLIRLFFGNDFQNKFLFDHHFFTNRYYLHKSASAKHMAKILNINTETLNKLTIYNYHLNFDELCEKYRFAHFWDELTNPINSELTINSIIDSAGFASNVDFSNLMTNYKEESKYIIQKKFL